jgi:hypothetical protein
MKYAAGAYARCTCLRHHLRAGEAPEATKSSHELVVACAARYCLKEKSRLFDSPAPIVTFWVWVPNFSCQAEIV